MIEIATEIIIRRNKITENIVGSIIYFDELFEGHRVQGEWKVIELKENELILLKAMFFIPIYSQASFLSFGKNTKVTHKVRIGFSFIGLEKIFDWFVNRFILTTQKKKAIEQHAREEFKNLESIL